VERVVPNAFRSVFGEAAPPKSWIFEVMNRLIPITLILVCHVAAFVALYFGLIKGVALCGSEIVVFDIPFLVAVMAYAVVFARIIRTHTLWTRGLFILLASMAAGVISAIIGMIIAFNTWGT
jgi:hypothetical protein